jgi:flagellar FliJ protein
MAKKFQYRLEPLLKLKSYNSTIARTELTNAINERMNKEEEIENITIHRKSLNNMEVISMNVSKMQHLHYFKQSLEDQKKKLSEEKEVLAEKEKVKQSKYNIAMQEEKVLAKLKEKKIEDHKKRLNLEEQKELDEIGLRIKLRQNEL